MPRVLLVDDEPATRFLIGEGLADSNIDFDEAGNGEEALRLMEKSLEEGATPYDAVVLDIIMPIMDGWEVLKRVKANPVWADLIVVVVTGYAITAEEVAVVSGYDSVFIEKRGNFARLLDSLLGRLLID
jgi:CheY-like chemotaxis protein